MRIKLTQKEKDKFWSLVDVLGPDYCWRWKAGTIAGYGTLKFRGKPYKAHRVSLYLLVGPPPKGKPWAIHSCRDRSCTNPRHVAWGSPSKNNGDDKYRDGTVALGDKNGTRTCPETRRRGLDNHYAKYPDSLIQEIFLFEGTQEQKAIKFGVNRSYVNKICRRKARKEATKEL